MESHLSSLRLFLEDLFEQMLEHKGRKTWSVAGKEDKMRALREEPVAKFQERQDIPLDFKYFPLASSPKRRRIEEDAVVLRTPFLLSLQKLKGVVDDPADGRTL